MQEEYLKNWDENKVYDEAVKEEIEKRFSFAYPYKYLEDIPVQRLYPVPKEYVELRRYSF